MTNNPSIMEVIWNVQYRITDPKAYLLSGEIETPCVTLGVLLNLAISLPLAGLIQLIFIFICAWKYQLIDKSFLKIFDFSFSVLEI